MARGIGRRGLRGLGAIICLFEERGIMLLHRTPHPSDHIFSIYQYYSLVPRLCAAGLKFGPTCFLSFFLVLVA